jgi:hypothetical protein
MHQQQIPDQLAAATVEGTTKRGKQRKILRDEFEDGLNAMGTKKQASSGHRPSEMEEGCIGRWFKYNGNEKTGRQWPETVGNRGRVHWKMV